MLDMAQGVCLESVCWLLLLACWLLVGCWLGCRLGCLLQTGGRLARVWQGLLPPRLDSRLKRRGLALSVRVSESGPGFPNIWHVLAPNIAHRVAAISQTRKYMALVMSDKHQKKTAPKSYWPSWLPGTTEVQLGRY